MVSDRAVPTIPVYAKQLNATGKEYWPLFRPCSLRDLTTHTEASEDMMMNGVIQLYDEDVNIEEKRW